MQQLNSKELTTVAIVTSIFLLFGLVPFLGYISIGILKITIMPTIFLIAVEITYLKTKINIFFITFYYSFWFGITSLIQSIISPDISSFIFINPLFSIIPRLLMGFFITFAFIFFKKINSKLRAFLLAFLVTTYNTIFVLSFVYLLGPIIYSSNNYQSFFKLFSYYILLTNYLPETIICNFIFIPTSLILKTIIKY